jgi:hypothetical protein
MEIDAMDPQLEDWDTLMGHAIDAAIFCGEFCTTLALILAFLVFAMLAWPFMLATRRNRKL